MGEMDRIKGLTIGMIPGSGRMGRGIAFHLARAGLRVLLGSRDLSKAQHAATQLLLQLNKAHHNSSQESYCKENQDTVYSSSSSSSNNNNNNNCSITALTNLQVASMADVIFWSPRGGLQEREALLKSLAPHLKDKIIVDVTNILYFMEESHWGQTSSTLLNQEALGVPARWTTAFKSTFASMLEETPMDKNNPQHTFVVGDDAEAVEITIDLVNCVPGFRGIRAGGLRNSKIVELLGPMWLIELDNLNEGGREISGWKFGV